MPMKFQNILYNRLYEHLNANTFVSQCTYLYEESEDRAFNVRAHSDSRAEYLALAHSSAFFPPFILRVHLASSHTLIFLFSLDLRFFFVVFFAHRVRLVSPLSISKRQIVSQSFLLQFNEIIRTTRSTASCCLFPSCGWRLAIESAPFRVTWPLKHRRKEFYVRPGARALRCLRQARARAPLLFGSVSSGRGPVSFGVFDCCTMLSERLRLNRDSPLAVGRFRVLWPLSRFRLSVLQNQTHLLQTPALCRVFSYWPSFDGINRVMLETSFWFNNTVL